MAVGHVRPFSTPHCTCSRKRDTSERASVKSRPPSACARARSTTISEYGGVVRGLIAAGPPSKVPAFARLVDEPVTDVRATLIKIATLSLQNYATVREQKLFNIWLSDGVRLAKAGWSSIADSNVHGRRRRLHSLMRRLVRDGWLPPGDPRLLEMELMGPLIIRRLYRTADIDVPEVRQPRAFARQHVNR